MASRGGTAVLLGRWTAFARTLVPRVAGAAGLPYRRFVLFDGVAVAVWVPGTVLAGWAAGGLPPGLPAVAGVAVVVAVAVAVALRRRRVRRRGVRRACSGRVPARRGSTRRRPGPRRPGEGRTAPVRRGAVDRC